MGNNELRYNILEIFKNRPENNFSIDINTLCKFFKLTYTKTDIKNALIQLSYESDIIIESVNNSEHSFNINKNYI